MKNQIIESILSRYPNLAWEYKNKIDLSSIDRKRSHKNQARIDQVLIPSTVEKYTNDMRQGDEFPALVLFPDNAKQYVVVDGNHRVEAALKNGKAHLDAYLVITDDPSVRMLLTYEFNRVMTGTPPSDADTDYQAVFLFNQGVDKSEISQHLRIPVSRIEALIRESAGRHRADTLDVRRQYDAIGARESRIQVNRLNMNQAFITATKAVAKMNPTIRETRDLINEVLAVGSETEQVSFLQGRVSAWETAKKEAATNSGPTAKKKSKRVASAENPRHLLKAHVGYMVKLDPTVTLAGLDASERKQWKVQIQEAITSLEKALAFVE